MQRVKQTLNKNIIFTYLIVVLLIPVSILLGSYFLPGRYYLISSVVIILSTLPFFINFESQNIKAESLVMMVVFISIVVLSRVTFAQLKQHITPVIALVIIAGICMGLNRGFIIGSFSIFISNFFLGQGPFTFWQMFALGLVGFLSPILYKSLFINKKRHLICFLGIILSFTYSLINNLSFIFIMQLDINFKSFLTVFAGGLYMDIILSLSTAAFLFLIIEPVTKILNRISNKYNI